MGKERARVTGSRGATEVPTPKEFEVHGVTFRCCCFDEMGQRSRVNIHLWEQGNYSVRRQLAYKPTDVRQELSTTVVYSL